MESMSASKSQSSQPTKSNPKREIPQDEVRVRAYQIYVARNREPGHDMEDWLQAERELLSRN